MTQRRRDPHSAAQRARRQQRVNQKVDTAMQSPCGAKPKTIASGDVTLNFLETDKQKGSKYRLRVTWPEVTEDTDGFPVSTIQQYVVHLQHSDDGSTWDSDFRRKVVDVKDGDDNTTAKAIFKNITRKRYYRVRVRAKDSKGCKSDLPASWSASARAGGSDTVPSVGAITKTRVGPRRIEFDWDDVEHPDFDRYKVVILKADTSGGTYSVVRTRYVRHSNIAVHVADTDKTKWWKVRVRVQLQKNPDGTTDESGDTDSTADQVDDVTAGPTAAPSQVTGVVTKRRMKAIHVSWNDDQNDTTQEPVKYQIYCGSTDPGTSPSFTATLVTKGNDANITKFWNGSTYVNFTAANAGTTYYIRVRGKNAVGTGTMSAQATGSPKRKVGTNTSSNATDTTFGDTDPDATEIVANRFIADDGTGDRIVIADTIGTKAKISFVGSSGANTLFTVGSAGNVTVSGGRVDFTSGITIPTSRVVTFAGAVYVTGNKFYWYSPDSTVGWRYVAVGANNVVAGGTV